jgi:penicillin-binding protein 1C
VKNYLQTLRRLGFVSLNRDAAIYDEGLALGNGEVSLYELVQGYSALANRGLYKPLRVIAGAEARPVRIYSPEAVSLIGNILSDPRARALEFGNNSVLNLPVQTAAKTGTATDYRDAWAIGYDDRFIVGVWMGNLDHSPMDGITGSGGPALALRSVFAELNRNRDTRPLYFSPLLVSADICTRPPAADGACPRRTEWFVPGTVPASVPAAAPRKPSYELVRPTAGLQIAYDPRIPLESQKFRFEIRGMRPGDRAAWRLDGAEIAQTSESTYLWPVARGPHALSVSVYHNGDGTNLAPVRFLVK